MQDPHDDPRWTAVRTRDGQRAGTFVFAVRTTGVYCRPGCPSRLPRRENVRFFDSPREAAVAGFRPCKRCQPDDPARGDDRVVRARAALDADPTQPLPALCASLGVSADHLRRLFQRELGMSPSGYARLRRLTAARDALRGGATATEATYAAGYSAPSRLYADAGALGMTPAAYGRGGAGETLAIATGPAALGVVLVAASPRGVCAVGLWDDEGAARDALRAEFPRAALAAAGDDAAGTLAQAALEAVQRAVQAPAANVPTLPLDLRGTAFQLKVWQALRQIPRGETRSYAQLAAAIGQPSATRAVAQACGANHAAVIVPCHRVIAAGGGLGGYKWGTARKRALLAAEAATPRA